jgi:hypothetical protein
MTSIEMTEEGRRKDSFQTLTGCVPPRKVCCAHPRAFLLRNRLALQSPLGRNESQ